MTIGKETSYVFGLVNEDWQDLPSGTVLPIRGKGFVKEIKVVDPNTLAFSIQAGENYLQRTLVGEEINASGFRIGPSNFLELITGKSTRLYWDPDKPGGEDMENVKQIAWYPQPAGT